MLPALSNVVSQQQSRVRQWTHESTASGTSSSHPPSWSSRVAWRTVWSFGSWEVSSWSTTNTLRRLRPPMVTWSPLHTTASRMGTTSPGVSTPPTRRRRLHWRRQSTPTMSESPSCSVASREPAHLRRDCNWMYPLHSSSLLL